MENLSKPMKMMADIALWEHMTSLYDIANAVTFVDLKLTSSEGTERSRRGAALEIALEKALAVEARPAGHVATVTATAE